MNEGGISEIYLFVPKLIGYQSNVPWATAKRMLDLDLSRLLPSPYTNSRLPSVSLYFVLACMFVCTAIWHRYSMKRCAGLSLLRMLHGFTMQTLSLMDTASQLGYVSVCSFRVTLN